MIRNYLDMPFKEWDQKMPLALYDNNDFDFWQKTCQEFFFTIDDVIDFAKTHDILPEQLRLVICEPLYGDVIYPENLWDEMPEGKSLKDFWPELAELIGKANQLIIDREAKGHPWSWMRGKYRTTVSTKGTIWEFEK